MPAVDAPQNVPSTKVFVVVYDFWRKVDVKKGRLSLKKNITSFIVTLHRCNLYLLNAM